MLVEAARRLRILSELPFLESLSESAALDFRTGIVLLTGSPLGRPFPMALAARERGELLLESALRLLEEALRVTVLLRELSLAMRFRSRLRMLREIEPVLDADDLVELML